VASLPRPPKVEKTKGVNDPQSTLRTLSPLYTPASSPTHASEKAMQAGSQGSLVRLAGETPLHQKMQPDVYPRTQTHAHLHALHHPYIKL